MSEEFFSREEKERMRKAWEQMFLEDAISATDSPSPNAGLIALLNSGQYQIKRVENIEERLAEIKEDTEKMLKKARRVDDLMRRMERLQHSHKTKGMLDIPDGYEVVEIDPPIEDLGRFLVVPTEILRKYGGRHR